MMTLINKIKKLFSNKNFVRATVVYLLSLSLGVAGFFVLGDAGWYAITCLPGFGTGVALALLNNGHKKPVTWKSVGSTVLMTVLLAVIMYFLSAPILSLFLGWGFSFVGSLIGLWFCRWENKKSGEGAGQEIIDVFDEHMNKVGEMEKGVAHDNHLWHKNAHVWVSDGSNVLVQLRAKHKKNFPNKWDISVAGHFSCGDTPLECAKREWGEELGLPWTFGDVKENAVFKWGVDNGYHVYEFVYLFFVKGKPDINRAKLQKEEVATVKWLSFDEFKTQIKTDLFCPYSDEYWEIVLDGLGKLMD